MPPRKEPCRNFLRGSCQYGERCKFLHAAQVQSKPNPFGFGSQSSTPFQSMNLQQPKSNPFGFGVQSNSQPRGPSDFGLKQNLYKPFQNSWTRSANTNSSSSRQSDNQPVAPNHNCTDAESCRRQIVEDFDNEKPLWMLTCYGHRKNGPCDISGDVSFEELRAAAYDDAKRGQSLTSIVERERSLLNSKLAEFEKLLQNPYVAPSTSVPNAQSPFSGATPNASFSAQSSAPPTASSFSQLGSILNTGASAPTTNTFGQPNSFGNSVKTSTSFGMNTLPFGNAGSFSFGSQVATPSHQNPFTTNNITIGSERSPFSTSTTSPHFPISSGSQFPIPSDGHVSASAAVMQSPVSINSTNAGPKEEVIGDDSIWSKKEWKIGEIPEVPPPDRYIF